MKILTVPEIMAVVLGLLLIGAGLWTVNPLLAMGSCFLVVFAILVIMRVCSWIVSVEQDLLLIRDVMDRLNIGPK